MVKTKKEIIYLESKLKNQSDLIKKKTVQLKTIRVDKSQLNNKIKY